MKQIFFATLCAFALLGCETPENRDVFLGAGKVYPQDLDIPVPEPVQIDHGAVKANTPVATNMVPITKALAENINEKIGREEATNLVLYVRDRFYDPELDVTWAREVTGGRIFYDVEGIGDTTDQEPEPPVLSAPAKMNTKLRSTMLKAKAAKKRTPKLSAASPSARKTRSLSASLKEDLHKSREEMSPVEAWHNFLKPNGKVELQEDIRPDPYDVEKEDPHKRKPRK